MIDISFPSVTLSGVVISVHSNVTELWWDWIKKNSNDVFNSPNQLE